MKRKKRIEKILCDNFKYWLIEVKDLSLLHKGHNNFSGNNETHFSIILQPPINNSFKRIEIHQKVNFLLKKEFASGLHALEINIKN